MPELFLWFISTFTPHTQRKWQTKMVQRIKRGEQAPTVGLGDPIKNKKNKQIIHLQATAVFPIEAKMNGHITGVTYRLNTQSSAWNTEKAERKQRNADKSLFISFFWRFGEMWQGLFFRGFRPTRLICCICSRTIHKSDNNSCRSSENHSVALPKLSLLGNKCSDYKYKCSVYCVFLCHSRVLHGCRWKQEEEGSAAITLEGLLNRT